MKISIITTITNPEKRQDPFMEAISCYADFADEVIVVNGGEKSLFLDIKRGNQAIKEIIYPWPDDWGWEELPLHLNAGLKAATGDWVLKLDIDQFIHEDDFEKLRGIMERNTHEIGFTMQKFSMYPRGNYLEKGETVVGINKKLFGNVMYGRDVAEYTDLCRPIINSHGQDDKGVPHGKALSMKDFFKSRVKLWNMDYTFKTEKVSKAEFHRFSLAHLKYFGQTSWGRTPDEAWQVFLSNMRSRVAGCSYSLSDINTLPSYIRERYKNLTPEEFGYSGWGIV